MRKRIKKIIALVLVITIAVTNVVMATASTPDTERLPVRAIFEEGSATVDWNDADRSVEIEFMDTVIILHTQQPIAYINDVAIPLQDNITLQDGRSFISERDMETVLAMLMGGEVPLGNLADTIMTIEMMVPAMMEHFSIPGVTIALVHANTDFTWTAGFGYADTRAGIPVDEHTLFSLASISKTFTAIAVMQLVEQGIVDLDEPIVTYLPQFSQLPDVLYGTGDYRNITVRMLLAHASGILGDLMTNMASLNEYYRGFMENFFDNLAPFPMSMPEGYIFSYANNNFTILGMLVAALATDYDSFFDGFVRYTYENIFIPAGMDMTTFYLTDRHMPYVSHSYRDAQTREELVLFSPLPTGGIFSNAYDMARFMHIMLNNGSLPDGDRLLSANSVRQMFALQNANLDNPSRIAMYSMGFGLGIIHNTGMEGFTRIGHGGNAIHFHSEMAIDHESGIGLFVSVNSVSGLPVVGIMMTNILLAAIHESTGVLRLPVSDETVEPIEFVVEDFEYFAGMFTQAGAADFIRVDVTEDGMRLYGIMPDAMVLIPLSDGSVVCTETGLRFWFDLMYDEAVLFIGEFRDVILGLRLAPETIAIQDGFERWIGEYFAQVEEGFINNVYRIVVGIEENGVPFMRTHTLNGLVIISPIIALDEENFIAIRFSEDAEGTWLHLADGRFLRG